MTSERTWIDAVRGTSVLAVAAALRLKFAPARGASGGSIYGCPACGKERRHESRRDRRGAIGVRHDGIGFRCMDCDVSGDAIDLVALVLRGKRFPELADAGRTEVREWFDRFAGLDLRSDPPQGPIAPPPPAEPVSYPPEHEVRAFYDRCTSVDADTEVDAYLEQRGLKVGSVAGFDLARALPKHFKDLPGWASCGGVPWTQSGHRLIVPFYDKAGHMRSVLARAIVPARVKSYAPNGYTRRELVMACGFARWLLATGVRPDWWPLEHEMRIVVAEGEINWLAWATQWSDAAEYAPATLGVVSGAWCEAIALRIADLSKILIAPDNDKAGDGYADVITRSFAGRNVTLERWEASE